MGTDHSLSSVNTTVEAYSVNGAAGYEDPQNWNSVYGNVTQDFLENIKIAGGEGLVLDVGCGTGYGFDVLGQKIEAAGKIGLGIEPSTGMLEIAKKKYAGRDSFGFKGGSFEDLPLENQTVDNVISTLALHWVPSLEAAAANLHRVLKKKGSLDVLMVAKDDGQEFKKSIVAAQRKHLSFKQIMASAVLIQRVNAKQCKEAFSVFEPDFHLNIEEERKVVYGSFDEHMKWWEARSTQIISEIKDKAAFLKDFRGEMEKTKGPKGIPFDASFLKIHVRAKG